MMSPWGGESCPLFRRRLIRSRGSGAGPLDDGGAARLGSVFLRKQEPRVPGDAQASLGSCLRRSTSQGLPMTASTPTIDAAEAAHFGALAADWWNPSGASAMLHRLNPARLGSIRSEEHTSELQSLMRISYDLFCLNKTKQ